MKKDKEKQKASVGTIKIKTVYIYTAINSHILSP